MRNGGRGRVLVLDGLWNKTVAAVRSFGRRGLFVGVGERTRFAPAMFSRYCSRRFLHPSPVIRSDDFLPALESELSANRYDVMLATEFSTQNMIARHRKRFEPLTRFPYASETLSLRVQDKREIASLAQAHGIEIPKTYSPGNLGEANLLAGRLPYPVLVKPRFSSGGRGIVRVAGRDEFGRAYLQVHTRYPEPIIQECLPPGGDALCVAVLMNYRSEPRASFVYRRLREYPVTGGPSTLRESIRDDALRRKAEELLSSVGWIGVALAEFKVDPRDGRPKLLEVNPRFWGSLNHAIVCGVDFPWLLYRMAMDGDVEPQGEYRVGVRSRSLLPGELLHFARNPRRFRLSPGLSDFTIPDDLLSGADPWPALGRLSSLLPAVYDRELREVIFG
ncbi:MAG TPA: ATP-grasp domain-containing protein [Candidatus Deferrimicrobiaceae bacterium]